MFYDLFSYAYNFANWKKALLISFLAFSVILVILLVIDVFSQKDFNLRRVFILSTAYMVALMFFFSFEYMILSWNIKKKDEI